MQRADYVPAVRKAGEKKSLRWKDEAGEGDLVDSSMHAPPGSSDAGSKSSTSALDSEWEDEKTEDSLASINHSSILSSSMSRASVPALGVAKKGRSSRMDPNYMKAKRPTLGSLMEDDETGAAAMRKVSPLTDRANRLPEMGASTSSLKNPLSKSLNHLDDNTPPTRLGGATPRSTARRRSNIGPVRTEKARRRSSLLQQPSPPFALTLAKSTGPRRVLVSDAGKSFKSPAKRVKRLSLLGSSRLSSLGGRSTLGIMDQNAANSSKAVWR